jgi:hypothetical protein
MFQNNLYDDFWPHDFMPKAGFRSHMMGFIFFQQGILAHLFSSNKNYMTVLTFPCLLWISRQEFLPSWQLLDLFCALDQGCTLMWVYQPFILLSCKSITPLNLVELFLVKSIGEPHTLYTKFQHSTLLSTNETRVGANKKLELWRQTLE